jgi:hypothetical protein
LEPGHFGSYLYKLYVKLFAPATGVDRRHLSKNGIEGRSAVAPGTGAIQHLDDVQAHLPGDFLQPAGVGGAAWRLLLFPLPLPYKRDEDRNIVSTIF